MASTVSAFLHLFVCCYGGMPACCRQHRWRSWPWKGSNASSMACCACMSSIKGKRRAYQITAGFSFALLQQCTNFASLLPLPAEAASDKTAAHPWRLSVQQSCSRPLRLRRGPEVSQMSQWALGSDTGNPHGQQQSCPVELHSAARTAAG